MKKRFLAFALLLSWQAMAYAAPLNIDTIQGEHALRQNLMWLEDPNNEFTIDDVSSGAMQAQFKSLKDGFPIESHSPIWLNLTLTKGSASQATSAPLRLHIGDLPSGAATIFRQHTDANIISNSQWWSEKITANSEYILPIPGAKPIHLYIKMDDTPDLWFSPTITQQKITQGDILPLDIFLKGLFILAIIGCLLRALSLQAAWPIWGTIFVSACLAQVLLPMPLLSKPVTQMDVPRLIAPGLALLLLPHLGRALLGTNKKNKVADGILTVYSLLGLAVCLVPFLPQTVWLARLFPLWPLLVLPIFPVAWWGVFTRAGNYWIFFLLCLLPIAGAVLSLLLLTGSITNPLAEQAPYWGLALAALGLCFAKKQSKPEQENSPEIFSLIEDFPDINQPKTSADQHESLLPTLQENNGLHLVETQLEKKTEKIKDSHPFQELVDKNVVEEAKSTIEATQETKASFSEPVENVNQSKIISLVDDDIAQEFAELQNQSLKMLVPENHSNQRIVPFNLETLVENVSTAVNQLAVNKEINFSWHIAPNTPKYFLGEAISLQQALFLLLQNAVRSLQNGDVELAVRANCLSESTCTLVFTISDTGSALRSESGIQHAWNLAARTGGGFSLEYTPNTGAVMSFSVILTVPDPAILEAEQKRVLQNNAMVTESISAPKVMVDALPIIEPVVLPETALTQSTTTQHEQNTTCRILVADMTTSNRHLITNYLGDLPCELLEAKEAEHVGVAYGKQPVELIIFDGSMPEAEIALSIEAVRQIEKMQHLPAVPILALATHAHQGQRLLEFGCTHILYKPFSKESLIEKVNECLSGQIGFSTDPDVMGETPAAQVDQELAYVQSLLGERTTTRLGLKNKHLSNNTLPTNAGRMQKNLPEVTSVNKKENEDLSANFAEQTASAPTTQAQTLQGTDSPITTNEISAAQEKWNFWQFPQAYESTPAEAASEEESYSQSVQAVQNNLGLGNEAITKKTASQVKAEEPSFLDLILQDEVDNTRSEAAKGQPIPAQANSSNMGGNQAQQKGHKVITAQFIKKPGLEAQKIEPPQQPEPSKKDTKPRQPVCFLPDIEGETIDVTLLPLVPSLITSLSELLNEMLVRHEDKQTIMVQQIASNFVEKTESFGLSKLSKIASCIERAAEADDLEAVDALLEDLTPLVQKYSDSLGKCYQSYLQTSR